MLMNEVADDLFEDKSEHLAKLSHAISHGHKPTIVAASYSMGKFSWGDLEHLGWASKHKRFVGRPANYEVWWAYSKNAPGPIVVDYGGKQVEMQPGEEEEPFEVDYS